MNKIKIQYPVVFLFFLRTEISMKVFESIRSVKPNKLYLFSDGPRNDNERILVETNRNAIVNKIDWDCSLKTFFLESNLGVYAIWSYICKEVFANEEAMIYLQEDLLASQSFFYFCDQMLEYYKDDNSVYMIAGTNYLGRYNDLQPYSYFFLDKTTTLGFAIWKRTYDNFVRESSLLEDTYVTNAISARIKNTDAPHWFGHLILYLKNPDKTNVGEEFDLMGVNSNILYNSMVIIPSVNLIKHIGNNNLSENMSDIKLLPKSMRYLDSLDLYELEFPILHQKFKIIDFNYKKLVNIRLNHRKIYIYFQKIERVFRVLIFGGPRMFLLKVRRRISYYFDFEIKKFLINKLKK
jgi:hypothetical protein